MWFLQARCGLRFTIINRNHNQHGFGRHHCQRIRTFTFSITKTLTNIQDTSTSAPAQTWAADLFSWLERSRKATRREPQLPPFSNDRVRNWFNVAEKQFESGQIDNQHDKLPSVAHTLDPATTAKVMDVIETQPMTHRYNIFRAALIDRFALSSRQQAH